MPVPRLAHNVFFKLKDDSPAKVQALVDDCKKYLNVQAGIVFFAAGPICRELDRDVNDRAWDVGLHIVFIDKSAHDAYQEDATHNTFIERNKSNWSSVRVFDSLV
jgi:stress responsive alpha/beta barrel protein